MGFLFQDWLRDKQRARESAQLDKLFGNVAMPATLHDIPMQGGTVAQLGTPGIEGSGIKGGNMSPLEALSRMSRLEGDRGFAKNAYSQVAAMNRQQVAGSDAAARQFMSDAAAMHRQNSKAVKGVIGVEGQPDMRQTAMMMPGGNYSAVGLPYRQGAQTEINMGTSGPAASPLSAEDQQTFAPGTLYTDSDGDIKRVPPLTDAQQKAVSFASRMSKAGQGMESLVGTGEGQMNPAGYWAGAVRDWSPDFLESTLLPKEQENYLQYARDWIRAKLRKESGAVIAEEEMRGEYETYFPMSGDDPSTIKQKAAARWEAEQGMRYESGGGYELEYGEAPNWYEKYEDKKIPETKSPWALLKERAEGAPEVDGIYNPETGRIE